MSERMSGDRVPRMLKVNKSSAFVISVKGNENLEYEFYDYAINFKKSAFMLANHLVRSKDISQLDTYFFSLAYLYRHSLELLLKSVAFKHIIDVGERIEFVKGTRHNLLTIFGVVKDFVARGSSADMPVIQWLENLFLDMNQIDKDSDSFRYPFGIIVTNSEFTKYIIKPFFDEQTHINLILFVNKMEIAFDIVNSFYSGSEQITNEYRNYSPVFLEEGGSYYEQSVLGYKYSSMQFFPYVKAYTETADLLFEFAKEREELRNVVFFPMCYLYRNAIELSMKEILFEECSHDFQRKLRIIKRKKHSLEAIWNSIKEDVEKVYRKNVISKEIASLVEQLHSFDVASDKFRYPTNTELQLHYKEKTLFDMEGMKKYFDFFANQLYNVCMAMSEYNEVQAEMMSYYFDSDYS